MTNIFTKSLLNKSMIMLVVAFVFAMNIDAKEPKVAADATESVESAQVLKMVRGFVVDEFGEPMVGVIVDALGSSKSTITNTEGKYSLLANKNDVLKFSQIGAIQKEEKITSSRIVNVELAVE